MRFPLAGMAFLLPQVGRPSTGNPDLERGLALLESGKAAEAIPHLRKGAADLPALPAASFYLGRALLLAGDPREAKETLSRAAGGAPLVPAVRLALGQAAAASGEFDEAEHAFQKAFELRSGDPAPLLEWGEVELRRAVFAKARDAFSRAETVAPGQPRALRGLGEASLGLMDLGAAEGAFRRALEARPDDGVALLGLGRTLLRRGDLEGAAVALFDAEENLPRDAEVAYQLGHLAAREGRRREAIGWHRVALQRDPAHPGALYALGQALLEAGELEEGRRVLGLFRTRKVLYDSVYTISLLSADAPADPELRESLVLCSVALGDLPRARRELEALGRLRPAWREDPRLEAVALCLEGRYEEALPRLKSALPERDGTGRAILEEVAARAAAEKGGERGR